MKKVSVGLIAMVDFPDLGGKVAILQIRGEFNHEKMERESFPGVCQITVHGCSEKGESFQKTLLREASEELGTEFSAWLKNNLSQVQELNKVENEENLIVNYGVAMPRKFLRLLRLNASTGGLKLITAEMTDFIIDSNEAYRVPGVRDRTVIIMFSEDKKAVKLAFKKIGIN